VSDLEKYLGGMPAGWDTPFSEPDGAELLEQALAAAVPVSTGTSGVYLLFNEGKVVYVGQSSQVYGRVSTHLKERIKRFDAYTIIPVPKAERVMRERQLIRTYLPYYNVTPMAEQGNVSIISITGPISVPLGWVFFRLLKAADIPQARGYVPAGYHDEILRIKEIALAEVAESKNKIATAFDFA
jgi:hypothetical protein